jgi:RNA recognition motif-containing protein
MDPFADVGDQDQIYISGLPTDTTEEEIAKYFGQIGIIKQASV